MKVFILLFPLFFAGCRATGSSQGYEYLEQTRTRVGRGTGTGKTYAEALQVAKVSAAAAAVGVEIDALKIFQDGEYRQRIHSRVRGQILRLEVLEQGTRSDGSVKLYIKVWIRPWGHNPLFSIKHR